MSLQTAFSDKFYFLSVTKASAALGIPGILTQRAVRLATHNVPLANLCGVSHLSRAEVWMRRGHAPRSFQRALSLCAFLTASS